MNKIASKEVVVISKEVAPVVKKAEVLSIKSDQDMLVATEFLSQLNKEKDRITAEKERITKPLEEALKVERSRWSPAEKILKTAIDLIRGKASVYQTALVLKREEEEAKIASRVGEGKGKLKEETASRKIDELAEVPKSTTTASGSLAFRTDFILEVVSMKDIPLEYMLVDESKLTKALKAGIEVSGARLKKVMTPVNKR